MKVDNKKYVCTSCGGDATVAYAPSVIKRGKNKGKEVASWEGKIHPGERICFPCGAKRGLRLF